MKNAEKCPVVSSEHHLEDLLKSHEKVFALFYASWCPFCVDILSWFQRCAEDRPAFFLMVQDDDELLAEKYSVNVFPSVLMIINGAISKRLDGILKKGITEEQLQSFINDCSTD